MKHYEEIPLERKTYPESRPAWGQPVTVPKGWDYRTDSYPFYQTADRELTFDLCVAGDWLEIVSAAENRRIRYEME